MHCPPPSWSRFSGITSYSKSPTTLDNYCIIIEHIRDRLHAPSTLTACVRAVTHSFSHFLVATLPATPKSVLCRPSTFINCHSLFQKSSSKNLSATLIDVGLYISFLILTFREAFSLYSTQCADDDCSVYRHWLKCLYGISLTHNSCEVFFAFYIQQARPVCHICQRISRCGV